MALPQPDSPGWVRQQVARFQAADSQPKDKAWPLGAGRALAGSLQAQQSRAFRRSMTADAATRRSGFALDTTTALALEQHADLRRKVDASRALQQAAAAGEQLARTQAAATSAGVENRLLLAQLRGAREQLEQEQAATAALREQQRELQAALQAAEDAATTARRQVAHHKAAYAHECQAKESALGAVAEMAAMAQLLAENEAVAAEQLAAAQRVIEDLTRAKHQLQAELAAAQQAGPSGGSRAAEAPASPAPPSPARQELQACCAGAGGGRERAAWRAVTLAASWVWALLGDGPPGGGASQRLPLPPLAAEREAWPAHGRVCCAGLGGALDTAKPRGDNSPRGAAAASAAWHSAEAQLACSLRWLDLPLELARQRRGQQAAAAHA